MKYIIIITLFLGCLNSSFGQVAIIKDKDGYTNLRADSSSDSKIIHKIKLEEPFWFDEETYFSTKKDWISVAITKNPFSIDCEENYIEGYIHRTRIVPLENLKKYTGNEFTFEVKVKEFDSSDKVVDSDDNNFISKINGRFFFGTDGFKPAIEITEIKIDINGYKMFVPKVLTEDLFNCSKEHSIYKLEKSYLIYQSCSDGAGYYDLVWVINERGVTKRLVGTII